MQQCTSAVSEMQWTRAVEWKAASNEAAEEVTLLLVELRCQVSQPKRTVQVCVEATIYA